MIPLDLNQRIPAPGTVVALPTGGAGKIEGDLLKALLQAGHVEARVLQIVKQTALIDFLNLGSAKVQTEVPLRAGDVFTAVVQPRAEGSADPLQLKISEIRHEPAAPMKPERLATELTEMRLPADAKHQAMARALLRHAGTVSREAMLQLNEVLTRLAPKVAAMESAIDLAAPRPEAAAQAAKLPVPVKVLEAAAFLVSKGLPVTEEAVTWVASRLNANATSGERLGAIARQLPDASTAAAQALLDLEVPDGDAAETAAHLAKLATAFTPPEARIARMLGTEPAVVTQPVPVEGETAEAAETLPGAVPRELVKPESAGVEARQGQVAQPESARQTAGQLKAVAEPLQKIQEALTAVLERSVRGGEGGEPIREALAEVRFGQLVNAGSVDPQHPTADRAVAMPLWWNGGSGEIRVQYQSKDGKKRKDGDNSETRVVVTLDTTHLQRVKVDLLLGRKQLNCQVSVEDPAVAEVLRQRLPELEEALEATGLRVNALGVKQIVSKSAVSAIDSLRQVDVWL
jgi:hypothetical protein